MGVGWADRDRLFFCFLLVAAVDVLDVLDALQKLGGLPGIVEEADEHKHEDKKAHREQEA